MKIGYLLLSLFFAWPSFGQSKTNFGTVTIRQFLRVEWQDPDTNQVLAEMRLFVADAAPGTNVVSFTNAIASGESPVQSVFYFREMGITDGPKVLWAIAVNNANLPSDPSETAELTFINKAPLAPGRFKLFTISQSVLALPTSKETE